MKKILDKVKYVIHIVIVLGLLGFGVYRYNSQTITVSKAQILLGTTIEIKAVSKSRDIAQQVDNAFALIKSYEKKLSYFDPNSTLYKLNAEGGTTTDPDFIEIMKTARLFYEASNGLYDVSIGNLLDVWDFATSTIPDSQRIEIAKINSGFDKITLTDCTLTIPKGIKINLGSLAKGYIVDKTIEYFISQKVKEVSVNAGGDIRFHSNGKKIWKVGIRHPRDTQTNVAILHIPDLAIVTSGDYENYFIKNETRYHHIINPQTGFPASPTVSVTIIAPTALIADAMSTAAFVMPPNDAIAMIKNYQEAEGIIYCYDENFEPVALKTEGIRDWER